MVRRQNLLAALLCASALSCGGKSLSQEMIVVSAGAGGALGIGGSANNAGAGAGSSGITSVGTMSGGTTGDQGGAVACTSAMDCLPSQAPCVYAACVNGSCIQALIAAGTFLGRDDPPDCYASVCNGNGQPRQVVDVGNVPRSSLACAFYACSASGEIVSTNLPAGSACSSNGGTRCDGAGRCVVCLGDSDCGGKGICKAGACLVGGACSDGVFNGDETDVDCGGSCSPCAVSRDCLADSDCSSQACDDLPPRRCLASHCNDHHRDGDETDVDCGGSCQGCGTFSQCVLNSDCSSGYCDPLRGNRCLGSTCLDGVQAYPESDVDCGGGQCDGCALGKRCEATWDCASNACDLLTLVCIQDHCLDHRFDGDETDTDCGGPNSCARCTLGQKCLATSDCGASFVCQTGNPHLCVPP